MLWDRCQKVALDALLPLALLFLGALSALSFRVLRPIVATVLSTALAVVSVGGFIALKNSSEAKAQELQNQQQVKSFVGQIVDRVRACIEYDKKKYTQQEKISDLLDKLQIDNHAQHIGDDDLRVRYVGAQGAIEHVLACAQALGEITQLEGAIHTPTPATPLCTRVNDELATSLLDETIRHDLDKLLTVKSRAEIVHEYLRHRGKLHAIYPKKGIERRSEEQQHIYKETLKQYPGLLFDVPLDIDTLDKDMIEATYLFRDREGHVYSFSIKARQTNDPKEQSEWAMWLGAVTNPVIQRRVSTIMSYLSENGAPKISL